MSSAGLPRRSGVGGPVAGRKGVGAPFPNSPATPNPPGQSPRAAVAAPGAPTRAAAAKSSARAEASRKNGAKSRGPKTPEGKARSAQNALKHGLRAEKHVVLPQEDTAAFAALEAALTDELAPQGVLQRILVGRIARAAWRLERAERLEVEVLEFRSYEGANPGLALIRDGNGTRGVETLIRYRNAAMAEFTRALKTLKALQAEHAAAQGTATHVPEAPPKRSRAPAPVAFEAPESGPGGRKRVSHRPEPDEPERGAGRARQYPEPPASGRTLHERGAPWLPKEPETGRAPHAPAAPASRTKPQPHPDATRPPADRAGRGVDRIDRTDAAGAGA